jgi:hypothetical protein
MTRCNAKGEEKDNEGHGEREARSEAGAVAGHGSLGCWALELTHAVGAHPWQSSGALVELAFEGGARPR